MPKTLLLADDSVTIQKVVGISFANEDFVLETVDNGDAAVERAAEIRPDIVLADVVMPGKSGYEVCETIKADPNLAGVPVLLLTGTFEAFDEERARTAGADGHITKPFEAQALVDAVKERLAAVSEPASPQAAAAPAAPSDGFDFLEDDQTEPSGLAAAAENARTTVLMDAPESDIGGAGAFAFETPDPAGSEIGEDTLEPVSEADLDAAPEFGSDRTQVVISDDLAAADTLPPADLAPSPVAAAPAASEPSALPEGDADDATRVVFGDEASALPSSGDLLGDPLAAMPEDDAVLDPTGARDYDVSSSDLGDPVVATSPDETTAPPQATPFAFEAPADEPAPDATRVFDLPTQPPGASEPALFAAEPEAPSAFGAEPEDTSPPSPLVAAPDVTAPPTPFGAAPEANSAPSPFDTAPAEASAPGPFDAAPEATSQPGPFDTEADSTSPPSAFGAAPEAIDAPAPFGHAPEATPEPGPFDSATDVAESASFELASGPPQAAEPFASPVDEDFPAMGAPPDTAADVDARIDRDDDESQFPSMVFGSPANDESAPSSAGSDELEASVPLASDTATHADEQTAMPDLGPLLRDQLHETLEKIAWETFGEVAENLVKQALERVEEVAWEVIPKMAEALIQEEIRKLKSEDDD